MRHRNSRHTENVSSGRKLPVCALFTGLLFFTFMCINATLSSVAAQQAAGDSNPYAIIWDADKASEYDGSLIDYVQNMENQASPKRSAAEERERKAEERKLKQEELKKQREAREEEKRERDRERQIEQERRLLEKRREEARRELERIERDFEKRRRESERRTR